MPPWLTAKLGPNVLICKTVGIIFLDMCLGYE